MQYRSLLAISDLTRDAVDTLLDAAAGYLPEVKTGGFKRDTLKGISTILLFYEPSTRTRVSFELAGKMLGSDTINISASAASIVKGESLRDTALTLDAMGFHTVVVRHPGADGVQQFARYFSRAVLSGGSGCGQHPTQALLDAFCLRQAGVLAPQKRIAIVGDLRHSRVMRSNVQLLLRFGLQVVLVAPPPLMLPGWKALGTLFSSATEEQQSGLDVSSLLSWETDLDRVLPTVDAVMMLRVQRERMAGGLLTNTGEYNKLYGLNHRRLKLLPKSAVIMHPGPVNRGVEVSEEVFADSRCLINEQVSCGVALRCALLCWAVGKMP